MKNLDQEQVTESGYMQNPEKEKWAMKKEEADVALEQKKLVGFDICGNWVVK